MRKEKKNFRSLLHTCLSVLLLLAVLAGGVGLSAAKSALNSYLDETPEGLYTLSEEFIRVTEKVSDPIRITFCADPDALLANQLTRYVYIMAREIERRMPNVEVVTCDVENNPTAVQQYRTTSASTIKWNHVIVSTQGEKPRYRIYTASRFWSYNKKDLYAFDGEYRMATAFLSLTAQNAPAAYFTVGHGEKAYDPANPESADSLATAAFRSLLEDAGLRVGTLDLDRDPIPADCTLLILNGPTRDYPTEDYLYLEKTGPIKKIDRYLDGIGSVMVFKDPSVSLPVLEEYLAEWGILFGKTGEYVRAKNASDQNAFSATYPTEKDMSYMLLSDILSLATPPRVSFRNSGTLSSAWEDGTRYLSLGATVFTAPLFRSPENATVRNEIGEVLHRGARPVAMVTRLNYHENNADDYYSYVLAAATTSLTENATLENTSFANYDALFSLVRTFSAKYAYADDSLGGLNANTEKYGGKKLLSNAIKAEDTTRYDKNQRKEVLVHHGLTEGMKVFYTVILCLVPLAVAAAGVIVYLRRKNR